MSDYLIREIEATDNITVRLNTEVCDGHGAERLEALTVRCRRDGRTEQVEATALFAHRPHLIDGCLAGNGLKIEP